MKKKDTEKMVNAILVSIILLLIAIAVGGYIYFKYYFKITIGLIFKWKILLQFW